VSGSTPGSGVATTTAPDATDPRLRGRTYAIPFDAVWHAALALTTGGGLTRRWQVTHADDQAGVIEARLTTALLRQVDLVTVRIGLDENGQTRVDLECRRETGRPRSLRHPRLAGGFAKALDRALSAGPGQIVDPTTAPAWLPEGSQSRAWPGKGT